MRKGSRTISKHKDLVPIHAGVPSRPFRSWVRIAAGLVCAAFTLTQGEAGWALAPASKIESDTLADDFVKMAILRWRIMSRFPRERHRYAKYAKSKPSVEAASQGNQKTKIVAKAEPSDIEEAKRILMEGRWMAEMRGINAFKVTEVTDECIYFQIQARYSSYEERLKRKSWSWSAAGLLEDFLCGIEEQGYSFADHDRSKLLSNIRRFRQDRERRPPKGSPYNVFRVLSESKYPRNGPSIARAADVKLKTLQPDLKTLAKWRLVEGSGKLDVATWWVRMEVKAKAPQILELLEAFPQAKFFPEEEDAIGLMIRSILETGQNLLPASLAEKLKGKPVSQQLIVLLAAGLRRDAQKLLERRLRPLMKEVEGMPIAGDFRAVLINEYPAAKDGVLKDGIPPDSRMNPAKYRELVTPREFRELQARLNRFSKKWEGARGENAVFGDPDFEDAEINPVIAAGLQGLRPGGKPAPSTVIKARIRDGIGAAVSAGLASDLEDMPAFKRLREAAGERVFEFAFRDLLDRVQFRFILTETGLFVNQGKYAAGHYGFGGEALGHKGRFIYLPVKQDGTSLFSTEELAVIAAHELVHLLFNELKLPQKGVHDVAWLIHRAVSVYLFGRSDTVDEKFNQMKKLPSPVKSLDLPAVPAAPAPAPIPPLASDQTQLTQAA